FAVALELGVASLSARARRVRVSGGKPAALAGLQPALQYRLSANTPNLAARCRAARNALPRVAHRSRLCAQASARVPGDSSLEQRGRGSVLVRSLDLLPTYADARSAKPVVLK